MDDPVRTKDGFVEIEVWVVPGASRTELAGLHGDAVRIRVSQPPEKGRANRAVAALLASTVGGTVRLVAGATGRRKTFRVDGGDEAGVRRALGI